MDGKVYSNSDKDKRSDNVSSSVQYGDTLPDSPLYPRLMPINQRYRPLPPIPQKPSQPCPSGAMDTPSYSFTYQLNPDLRSPGLCHKAKVYQTCYGVEIEHTNNKEGSGKTTLRERQLKSHFNRATPGGIGRERSRVLQTSYGREIARTHSTQLDQCNTRPGRTRSRHEPQIGKQTISVDALVNRQTKSLGTPSSVADQGEPHQFSPEGIPSPLPCMSFNYSAKHHLTDSAVIPNRPLPPIVFPHKLQRGNITDNSRQQRENYIKAPVTIINTDQAVNRTPSMEMAYYDYMGSLHNDSRTGLKPIHNDIFDNSISPFRQSLSSNSRGDELGSFRDYTCQSKTPSVKSRVSTPGVKQMENKNIAISNDEIETVDSDYDYVHKKSSKETYSILKEPRKNQEKEGRVHKKTHQFKSGKRHHQRRVKWHIKEPNNAVKSNPSVRIYGRARGMARPLNTLRYGTFIKQKPSLLESIRSQIRDCLGKFRVRFSYIIHYPNNKIPLTQSGDSDDTDEIIPVIKTRSSMHPFSRAHREQVFMDMTMNTAARYQMELDKQEELKTQEHPLTTPIQRQFYASTVSDVVPSIDIDRVAAIPCQTCDTDSSFKRLTKLRREVGLLDIDIGEHHDIKEMPTKSGKKLKKTVESLGNKLTPEEEHVTHLKSKKITKKVKKPTKSAKDPKMLALTPKTTEEYSQSSKTDQVNPPGSRCIRSKKRKRKTKKAKKKLVIPKTAVEIIDQWFPAGMREKSKSIPSWYPESVRAKVANTRSMEVSRDTKKMRKGNVSSPNHDALDQSGLMEMIEHIDAEFKADKRKSKKKCSVQWKDMLNDNYPCPTLDEWPEWWGLKKEVANATRSLESGKNRLLQNQEEMRRKYRLHTIQQMHNLDIQRDANDKIAMHPWVSSTQGKQDRRLQYWLHERTLGKDPYSGCIGCRMQGYEMNLRDNRPHLHMYNGLGDEDNDGD